MVTAWEISQVYTFGLFLRMIAKMYDRSSIFKAAQKPRYESCIQGKLCSFIFNLVLCLLLRFLYVRENKKRDRMLEGKTAEEIAAMKAESNLQGFENVTDGQNISCNSLHIVIFS